MKWILCLVMAGIAPVAFAGAPTPAELGARVTAFLQHGRDIHVVNTGFFLDGGSHYATLGDSAGETADIVIFNKRRALQMGARFGAFDEKHEREYIPTGEAQAAFQQAIIDALHRSQVSNRETQQLLSALTSFFPTYGEDLRWPASGDADAAVPLISRTRVALLGGAIVVLGLYLAYSLRRRHPPATSRA